MFFSFAKQIARRMSLIFELCANNPVYETGLNMSFSSSTYMGETFHL